MCTGRHSNDGTDWIPADNTISAVTGLIIIQAFGILTLVIGSLANKWEESLLELLFSYTIAPFLGQLFLCPAIGISAFSIRRLLLIK